MTNPITLEICVTSVESAVAAQEGGAQRVELCTDLEAGGVSPSYELIERTRKKISIALHVMIRPRGGDFCYSEEEFSTMKKEIVAAKERGADGVVFGILRHDRSIDVDRTTELVRLARPMRVTFHRAFDEASEPLRAFEDVVATGVDRLLTSGQRNSAIEGIDLIAKLVARSNPKITVIAGAGITARNVAKVLHRGAVREIHAARAVMEEGTKIVDARRVRELLAEAVSAPDGRSSVEFN